MKTGLVLSGGGARGIAHIGVIKAIEELQIKIDAISGVSAGAIFGALYASGLTVDEMFAVAQHADLFDLMDFRFGKPGLFKADAIRKTVEKNLKAKTFSELKIPLTVAATDFGNAQIAYFTSGSLVDAVVASSTIPVIFQPEIINGNMYVDGGLLNNFPVEPLLNSCDVIIGVHVNPLNTQLKDFNLRSAIERSFHMSIAHTIKEKSMRCTVFIEPYELHRFHVFDIKHANEIFEIGYDSGMKELMKIVK